MTDAAEAVGAQTEDVAGVELEWEPLPGGRIHLAARYGGEALETGNFARESVFTQQSYRGQFLNSVETALKARDVEKAGEIRQALNEWFVRTWDEAKEEQATLLPDRIRRVIEGTQQVEIYGGEETKVVATVAWEGQTRQIELTADQMRDGSEALASAMANKFFEFDFECGEGEWTVIRDHWTEKAEKRGFVDETGEDTIAERVLELIRLEMVPMSDEEELDKVETVWVDPTNTYGVSVVGGPDPVIWVEKPFILDQMKAIGRDIATFNMLVTAFNRRGDIYGVDDTRRRRFNGSQDPPRYYPFKPEALGIDVDRFMGDSGGEASEEVAP